MRRWAAQASSVSPLVNKPCSVANAALKSGSVETAGSLISGLLLQMGLEEPQVLVDIARNPRKEIRAIRISQLIGVGDRLAHGLAVHRHLRRQIEEMVLARGDAQGVVLQFAALGRHGDRALRRAAQAGDALRDLV